MENFELEIKTDFLNEALINLEEVESSFIELETAACPAPLLEKIFRLAHNLKGGSVAVGFEQVGALTHELESLVLKIQKNDLVLCSELINTLLHAKDKLTEMLLALKSDLNAKFDINEILNEIGTWLRGEFSKSKSVYTDKIVQQDIIQKDMIQPVPKSKEDEIIRVNLSKIDLLNDFVGELIVLQSVVDQQSADSGTAMLRSSVRQVMKLAKDIQGLSMSLRMLPVKPVVQKLQRVVRDTAQSLGKEVVLEVEGEQLDVDKSVLDKLTDPLIHILRNAVDHGLESAIERAQVGKSLQGKIVLSFNNQGNHLLVEVRDDGAGIKLDRVRSLAIEKNIISENKTLSEKQIVNLIFHPGFSTKSEADEISGRGVGMDVVKNNLEKIGGSIDVKTTAGQGSVFSMQIPLTLAVIEGLVVVSGKSRYVFPLSEIQETINLRSQKVHDKVGVGNCFELRGSVVPLVSLDEVLMSGANNKIPAETALVIQVNDSLVAIGVHDIVRSQQIVIKPFTNGIRAQKGWIGSCVLGDGLPTLILSPIELLSDRVVAVHAEENTKEIA